MGLGLKVRSSLEAGGPAADAQNEKMRRKKEAGQQRAQEDKKRKEKESKVGCTWRGQGLGAGCGWEGSPCWCRRI